MNVIQTLGRGLNRIKLLLLLAVAGFGSTPRTADIEALLVQPAGLHQDVWPGISLRLYATAGGAEYDWIVAVGSRPETIRMRFADAIVSVTDEPGGELLIRRSGMLIRHSRPRAYS